MSIQMIEFEEVAMMEVSDDILESMVAAVGGYSNNSACCNQTVYPQC
jgi:hypothetical protein